VHTKETQSATERLNETAPTGLLRVPGACASPAPTR
jgi:hypothetical protein